MHTPFNFPNLHTLGALLGTLLFSALSVTASAGTIEKIRASNTIVLAHREASIPFAYYDDNKKPIGYAIDLCMNVVNAIKRELKLPTLKVEWIPVTGSTRIPTIVEGKADLECGSTTNNMERRKLVGFTIPHFISASRFVVRSASPFKTIDDLQGKNVVSTKGTTNLKTLVAQNEVRVLHMNIIEAKDHAEAFAMVATGKADAFAMDDVLLYGLRANAASPRDFKVIGDAMTVEPYSIMLRKDDLAFKKIVDREVSRTITSLEINALCKKWFESPIPPKGINLELKIPFLLRDSFQFPSDSLPEL